MSMTLMNPPKTVLYELQLDSVPDLKKMFRFYFFPTSAFKICVFVGLLDVICRACHKLQTQQLESSLEYKLWHTLFIFLFLQEELSESLNLQKQLTEELQAVKQVCWSFFKIKSFSLEICLYPKFQLEQLPCFLLLPNTSVCPPPKLLPFLLSCTAAGFLGGSQLHQMQKCKI